MCFFMPQQYICIYAYFSTHILYVTIITSVKLVVYHIVNQTKIQNTKLYKKYRQANNYKVKRFFNCFNFKRQKSRELV